MYTQIKIYFFLVLLTYTNLAFSQSLGAPFTSFYNVDINDKANNYLLDAIPSLDGSSVLMVGYSKTNTEVGEQAFVVKMKRDGQIVFKKLIGKIGDKQGVSIAEDNYNRIIIAGNTKEKINKPWLKLIDQEGNILNDDLNLDTRFSTSKAIVQKIFFDKKRKEILCFGIKNRALWIERIDIETEKSLGTNTIKNKKIVDLKIVENQKLSILYSEEHYFIYCAAQYGEDDTKRSLIIKVDKQGAFVDHVSLSDIHVEAVGNIVDFGKYFGLVGTTALEDITPAEDIYFLKIKKDLNKDDYFLKKLLFLIQNIRIVQILELIYCQLQKTKF